HLLHTRRTNGFELVEIGHRLLMARHSDIGQPRPGKVLHPRRVGSDWVDLLDLGKGLWGVPPIVPAHPAIGMTVEPFQRRGLARIVAPMSDRKSTRLNSSHVKISYAVFCLKKKKETT